MPAQGSSQAVAVDGGHPNSAVGVQTRFECRRSARRDAVERPVSSLGDTGDRYHADRDWGGRGIVVRVVALHAIGRDTSSSPTDQLSWITEEPIIFSGW